MKIVEIRQKDGESRESRSQVQGARFWTLLPFLRVTACLRRVLPVYYFLLVCYYLFFFRKLIFQGNSTLAAMGVDEIPQKIDLEIYLRPSRDFIPEFVPLFCTTVLYHCFVPLWVPHKCNENQWNLIDSEIKLQKCNENH